MSWLKLIPILGSLIDPLGKIADSLVQARLDKSNAVTERAKQESAERITTLEMKQKLLLRDPYGPLVRFSFALPFILYDAKLVLWDKVLALGSTDSLSPELQTFNAMVLGFYFLQVYLGRRK